jgi:hypothetical protein
VIGRCLDGLGRGSRLEVLVQLGGLLVLGLCREVDVSSGGLCEPLWRALVLIAFGGMKRIRLPFRVPLARHDVDRFLERLRVVRLRVLRVRRRRLVATGTRGRRGRRLGPIHVLDRREELVEILEQIFPVLALGQPRSP